MSSHSTGLEFHMDTFFGHLKLATLGNLNRLDGLVTGGLVHILNLLYNVIALKNLAKDDVAPVKPGGNDSGDEELRSVCVLVHCKYELLASSRW